MADLIIHILFSAYHCISKLLPLRAWLFVGRFIGTCLYYIDAHHRKIALVNLRFAFGNEKPERELRKIALGHFKQLGMGAHEWITLKGLDQEGLDNLRYG